MRRPRWPLLLGIGVLSALLGYFLRDVVYQMVVVPLAYLLWVVNYYYSAIPQWLVWALVIGVLFVVVLWRMIPDVRIPQRRQAIRRQPEGQVEALAGWIGGARRGSYFKWQLANRLGRIARRLEDLSAPRGRTSSADPAVEKYIDAGLNYSFVDFLAPRGRFERAPRSPLDIDPARVVDYLESQMENRIDGRR